MGVLDWLLGSKSANPQPQTADPARSNRRAAIPSGHIASLEGPGTFTVEVVGESKYMAAFETICGPRTDEGVNQFVQATLVHEDDNPYDDHAIRIDVMGHTVGYLRRDVAREYRQLLAEAGYPHENACCNAVIRGGWDRGARGQGNYGVWLDLPTE